MTGLFRPITLATAYLEADSTPLSATYGTFLYLAYFFQLDCHQSVDYLKYQWRRISHVSLYLAFVLDPFWTDLYCLWQRKGLSSFHDGDLFELACEALSSLGDGDKLVSQLGEYANLVKWGSQEESRMKQLGRKMFPRQF